MKVIQQIHETINSLEGRIKECDDIINKDDLNFHKKGQAQELKNKLVGMKEQAESELLKLVM